MAKKRKLAVTPQSATSDELVPMRDGPFNEDPAPALPSEGPLTEGSSIPEFLEPVNEQLLIGEEDKWHGLETTVTVPKTAGAGETLPEDGVKDGEDDLVSMQQLIEPFSKDQLVELLKGAALKHPDVLDSIRQIADVDPAHRKVFVHGLGWNCTAETLIEAFRQFGEIEDCKAVVDRNTGRSKGYGFILFKHRSGAQRALKEPQKKIGSKMTACQLASAGPPTLPFSSPALSSATLPTIPTLPVSELTQRKIYVSNVGAEMDPNKVLQFFSKFGEIEEGPLGLDKVTGKPRGFCLFVYKNIDSAKKALEEPHKSFEGVILHCQKAIDGPKPNKQVIQPVHGAPQYGALHQAPSGFVAQGTQFGRIDATVPMGAAPSSVTGPGHLIAPPAVSIRFNHAIQPNATAPAGYNPGLGIAVKNGGLAANPAFRNQVGGPIGYAKPVGSYGASLHIHGNYANTGMVQGSTWTQQGLSHIGGLRTSTGQ